MKKALIALLILYICGAFVDYFAREGLKKGLWDNILWRDGPLPLASLAKGLAWPIHLISDVKLNKTTAEQLAELLNNTNDYPLCGPDGCIQEIVAKDNTVIATYSLPKHSSEFPKEMFIDRAATAEKLRPNVLRDICGSAQQDFPDRTMKWAAHYYTSDRMFLASVLVTMDECASQP